MTRQGPTLRLLVVCDGCEHHLVINRERGRCQEQEKLSVPYENTATHTLGPVEFASAYWTAPRFTPTPDWCPLAHLREVTPAEDELRRNLVAPMAEPVAEAPKLNAVTDARPDLRSSIRRGTL